MITSLATLSSKFVLKKCILYDKNTDFLNQRIKYLKGLFLVSDILILIKLGL